MERTQPVLYPESDESRLTAQDEIIEGARCYSQCQDIGDGQFAKNLYVQFVR